MKKLFFLFFLVITMMSCEGIIADVNEWWRYDVLKHSEEEEDQETATVTVKPTWPGGE